MAQTVTLLAPYSFYSQTARSGTTYTANGDGIIASVASNDITDLLNGGCKYTGNTSIPLPLLSFKTSSGGAFPAAASSGVFGIQCVIGTGLQLISEVTSSNSKTSTAILETELPPEYIAGTNFNIVTQCQFTSSGTSTSSTVLANAYAFSSNGTMSASSLSLTAAQTIASSNSSYTFVQNGAGLTAGQKILIGIVGVAATSSGSNTFQLNGVSLSI